MLLKSRSRKVRTASLAAAGIASGLAELDAALAEIVLALVHDERAADDGVRPAEGDLHKTNEGRHQRSRGFTGKSTWESRISNLATPADDDGRQKSLRKAKKNQTGTFGISLAVSEIASVPLLIGRGAVGLSSGVEMGARGHAATVNILFNSQNK